jgi:hypothetical protein
MWSRAGDAFTQRQYCEVAVSRTPGADGWSEALVRTQDASNFYFARWSAWPDQYDGEDLVLPAGESLSIWKRVAGVESQIGASTAAPAPGVLRLRIDGETLTLATADAHGGAYTDRLIRTDASLPSATPGAPSIGIQITEGDHFVDNVYLGDW